MQDLAVRQAEVTGDIPALLLAAGYPEGADFLIRRNEMRVEVVAHLPIGQRARTERLRVVSGEIGIFKVAGDVEGECEFVILSRFVGRIRGSP